MSGSTGTCHFHREGSAQQPPEKQDQDPASKRVNAAPARSGRQEFTAELRGRWQGPGGSSLEMRLGLWGMDSTCKYTGEFHLSGQPGPLGISLSRAPSASPQPPIHCITAASDGFPAALSSRLPETRSDVHICTWEGMGARQRRRRRHWASVRRCPGAGTEHVGMCHSRKPEASVSRVSVESDGGHVRQVSINRKVTSVSSPNLDGAYIVSEQEVIPGEQIARGAFSAAGTTPPS